MIGPVSAIVDDAVAITGLARGRLLGATREMGPVRIRRAIAWAAREAHGLGNVVIGRALGDRDHSTIRLGHIAAERDRATDRDFASLTEQLLTRALSRVENSKPCACDPARVPAEEAAQTASSGFDERKA